MFSLRLVVCAVLVVVVAGLPREDKYTTKYDNIDIDEILKSERLLKSYTNCLLDKGKCTPDGQELKANIPDALTNNCSKCSKIQKDGSEKILRFLLKNKKETYDELEAKYDTTGVYRKQYESKLKELSS